VAGVYRPRHSERTVLYRVLFHHFDQFLAEYESRFEKEHSFLRPIIKDVVEFLHNILCDYISTPDFLVFDHKVSL
jgi:hypothetical protein